MSKEHDESMAEIVKPENKVEDSTKTHTSPSGKYTLEVSNYKPPNKGWNCAQGIVRKGDEVIETVNRNYGSFPFAWCEEHLTGHDYLVCGETYMGQTIIELDTGKRADYNTASGREGFCWADYKISEDKSMIAVCGCYWACPYELWIVDFTYPLPFYGGSVFDKETPEHKWNVLSRLDEGHYVEDYNWTKDNDLEMISCHDYEDENGEDVEKKVKMVWRSPKLETLEEKGKEND
tara:strand:- start:7330 stop:8031 length:702 start_codon:yes stop_codon:yes gene_type:complete